MGKVIISITSILFCLLLVSCSSDENENLKKQRELRKGYTEINVYGYTYKLGELDKSIEIPIAHYKLDKDGNIKVELTMDTKGNFFTTGYEYNKTNMITNIYRLTVDGHLEYSETREYHEGDTIIAKRTYYKYDSPELLSTDKHERIYDDKGNEISYYCYHWYDHKGIREQSITENIYDNNGELTQSITIEQSGQYDMDNKVTKFDEPDTIITYYKDKIIAYTQDWEYGKIYDESKLYYSPTVSDKIKCEYNKDGLTIAITFFNDKKEPTYTFKYDYK
jgi:uncharacterized protein YcfL